MTRSSRSPLFNSSLLLLSSNQTGLLLLPFLSKSSMALGSFSRFCTAEGMLIFKQRGSPFSYPGAFFLPGIEGPSLISLQSLGREDCGGRARGWGMVAPRGSLGLGPFGQCPPAVFSLHRIILAFNCLWSFQGHMASSITAHPQVSRFLLTDEGPGIRFKSCV